MSWYLRIQNPYLKPLHLNNILHCIIVQIFMVLLSVHNSAKDIAYINNTGTVFKQEAQRA